MFIMLHTGVLPSLILYYNSVTLLAPTGLITAQLGVFCELYIRKVLVYGSRLISGSTVKFLLVLLWSVLEFFLLWRFLHASQLGGCTCQSGVGGDSM